MINNLDTIKQLVEVETGIKDISKKTRTQEYVDARVLFYILGIENAKSTYSKLARFLDKNHATVLHSYKTIYPQWLSSPSMFGDNIKSLHSLKDIVERDLEALNDTKAVNALFLNYKRRNTLLRKENEALRQELEYTLEENNRLKKYEPIW